MININKKIIDNNYRYKMNKIQTKIVGRGNGIKTVLINLDLIGKDLKRNNVEILKFIGMNKGAQIIFDNKFIVNGSFTNQEIQEQIYEYIKKFVLCEKCNLPETVYEIKKDKLYQKCNSCSASFQIVHKLCNFIIKDINEQENKESIIDDDEFI